MLPPFIIDQIRRREEESRRQELDRPRLELPVDLYQPEPTRDEADVPDRGGVIILDLG
jgi:hypothetical protein